MSRRAHLIFNPISGQGNAEEDLETVRSHLSEAFDLTICQTTPERGAGVLASQALQQDVDLVIASGGDGTVNAVAEALIESSIPMAILPRGTANAIASALNIPTNLEDACQVVLNGNLYAMDAARCNGRPMVLLAGIGFEADVVERTSRTSKNRLGLLAYIFSGLQQLRELKPFEVTLETHDRVISVEASAITVANVAPAMSVLAQGPAEVIADDGLLDVTIVAPSGTGTALAASYELFRSALNNEATQRDDIGYFRCDRIKITANPPQSITIDGELAGETPLDVVCIPHGLTVIVPQQPASTKLEDLEGLSGLSIESK